jgi:hypothetical protein
MTIDLEAITARAEKATEGPWFFTGYCAVQSTAGVQRHEDFWTDERLEDEHTYEHRVGQVCIGCGERRNAWGEQVWDCALAGEADDAEPTIATLKPSYGDTATGQRVLDAEFIAAARTDVPELVAEIERLRAIVEAPPGVKAHVQLDDMPGWDELAEALNGRLVNHEIGCSGEYETTLYLPNGAWISNRDELVILDGDAALSSPSGPVVVSGGTE